MTVFSARRMTDEIRETALRVSGVTDCSVKTMGGSCHVTIATESTPAFDIAVNAVRDMLPLGIGAVYTQVRAPAVFVPIHEREAGREMFFDASKLKPTFPDYILPPATRRARIAPMTTTVDLRMDPDTKKKLHRVIAESASRMLDGAKYTQAEMDEAVRAAVTRTQDAADIRHGILLATNTTLRSVIDDLKAACAMRKEAGEEMQAKYDSLMSQYSELLTGKQAARAKPMNLTTVAGIGRTGR